MCDEYGLEVLLSALLRMKARAVGKGPLAAHRRVGDLIILFGVLDPCLWISDVAHTAARHQDFPHEEFPLCQGRFDLCRRLNENVNRKGRGDR